MPLQPHNSLPSTPVTQAVEWILWAQADLYEAVTEEGIAYCRMVLERREAHYRDLMRPVKILTPGGDRAQK